MTEQTELTYYTILTNQGIQYEQECLNTSSEFHITHIAVGDGSGSATTPSKTQTGLIHEIARYPVSKEEVSITKGEYYATAEIPYSAGNFTIRELGGYNSAGKLVAVANFPPTNKQVQEEWDIHKVYVRMDLCRVNERTFPSVVNSDLAFVSAETFEREIDLKANKTLNNLSEYGNNRLHALKGYLDEGKVLTDAEGLAYVIKMAHSTFDSSKFTKVGTPTITDDGIYSDIDGSNYVSMSADFLSANTWKLTCPIPKIISNSSFNCFLAL